MDLNSLNKRWTRLLACVASAISMHAIVHFSSEKIAEGLSQPYAPLTERQAKLHIKAKCSKKINLGLDICQATMSEAVQMVNALHLQQYEEEKIQLVKEHAREIRLNFAKFFGFLYVALGFLALQMVVKWLRFSASPKPNRWLGGVTSDRF